MKIMNKTMKYKNYVGSVEYSGEGACFFSRLAAINDLVVFEGKTVDDLEKNFQDSVDDYIEFRKE